MSNAPVIQFKELDFAYTDRPLLSGVNIAVPDGDFVCVVGPNGCGKTTLL